MDPFVVLARLAIEEWVIQERRLEKVPEGLRAALEGQRAACFVSLHGPEGELRGCKGTLCPWHASLVEEIISNAISACSQDQRFAPIQERELVDLDVGVDVLSELEPVAGPEELDPSRYGVVISTEDGRRGVLLPDLESVDTVDQQLSIACRKAGIDSRRESYRVERFTVTRHGKAKG